MKLTHQILDSAAMGGAVSDHETLETLRRKLLGNSLLVWKVARVGLRALDEPMSKYAAARDEILAMIIAEIDAAQESDK